MAARKQYEHFLNVYDENTVREQRPPEYQLMVFWKKPRGGLDTILTRVGERFVIRDAFNLHWTPERIVENFQRFYAMVEGHAWQKFTQAGLSPFLMLIVEDRDPVYEYRVAGGSGHKMVNVKSFDLKQELRRQGASLHATNNEREFRRDLVYLIDRTAAEYAPTSEKWDGTIVDLRQDIVAADGWKSLPDVFRVLNEAVDYVVLRNFEELPDEHVLGPHSDIDFLVEDVDAYHRAASILNKEQAAHTQIGDRKIYFDFRAVEDFYYDPEWCRRLLREKVMVRGFYAVSPNDYFFSLLYHGHVHKPKISADYGRRLVPIAREIGMTEVTEEQITDPAWAAKALANFLKGNGFYLTRPNGCPAFNDAFVTRMAGTPFLLHTASGFYQEHVTLAASISHEAQAANPQDHQPMPDHRMNSRKWLIRHLAKRILAFPMDLVRRRLSPAQKDFLRPYVRKYTQYYEN